MLTQGNSVMTFL